MIKSDAAKLLNLSGHITPEDVKRAYVAACKKYHPDVNPGGLEMMKFINAANDVLKDLTGTIDADKNEAQATTQDYPEALNEALSALCGLAGLSFEICGAWLWISGNTREHKEAIKEAGCKWASKKKLWFFRPDGYRSRNRKEKSMNDIRDKWGSSRPDFRTRTAIKGAA